MEYSVWLQDNLIVKILPLSSNFFVDQEGRLGGPVWHLDFEKGIMGL